MFITMGFVASFTVAAVFFSVTTHIAGIDQGTLRSAAAILLASFGALLLWPHPFEWLWLRIGTRSVPGDRSIARFVTSALFRLVPRLGSYGRPAPGLSWGRY
jgi:hypothetical protein